MCCTVSSAHAPEMVIARMQFVFYESGGESRNGFSVPYSMRKLE
jgi:hypothetical protein